MLVRKDLPLLFYVLKNHEVCKYFLFPHKIEQVRSMKLSFFSNRHVEISLACEKYRLAHRSSSCLSADKLIKLFETFHDVSFVYVMHNFSSGFVTHRKHKKKDYDPLIDNQEDIVGVSNYILA